MTSMANSMYSAIIGGGAKDVIKNPNFPHALKAEIIKSYEDNNARVRKVTTLRSPEISFPVLRLGFG